MAEATPARISFEKDGGTIDIDFHAVISEAHDASGTMTKFPVQTGFEISNHSIRRNRKILIEAMVSNTPIVGYKRPGGVRHEVFSTNMPRARFEELQNLVLNSIPCTVFSNLGEYKPVVFTNFQTKQQQGLTDAIIFTIAGEEVQERSNLNKAGVTALSFEDLSQANTDNVMDEMEKQNIPVDRTASIQRTTTPATSSWSIPVRTLTGAHTETFNYIDQGESATSYAYIRENSNIEEMHNNSEQVTAFNVFALQNDIIDTVTRTATNTSACILQGISSISERALNTYLTTAIGEMQKSARGFLYDNLKVEGNSVLNMLTALSIDCFLVSVKEQAVRGNVPQEITDIIPPQGINRIDGMPAAYDYIDKARLGGYKGTNINLKREGLEIYRVWNPAALTLGNYGDLYG